MILDFLDDCGFTGDTCAKAPWNWNSNIHTEHGVCMICGRFDMSRTCPGPRLFSLTEIFVSKENNEHERGYWLHLKST